MEFLEGVSILIAIALCVVVGSWNNYAKEKQFQSLMAEREERDVLVIRDNKDAAVSVHGLLVGDILRVKQGDMLPADCVLLSGHKITTDESSQTGETRDIEKQPLDMVAQGEPNPFLISGTTVKTGVGIALVVAVGDNTRMGRLRDLMDEDDDETPLQRKLERIANGSKTCEGGRNWQNGLERRRDHSSGHDHLGDHRLGAEGRMGGLVPAATGEHRRLRDHHRRHGRA